MKEILFGAFIGFLTYSIVLSSAGNIVYRPDSNGVYRFKLFGALKQGIIHPFFRTAPTKKHTIEFFFRLDNPWFTIPLGSFCGFLISKYYQIHQTHCLN